MEKNMTNGTGQPQFQNSVDVKLDYIQRDVSKIQNDITIIKNDFVSRREFNEGLQEVHNMVEPLNKRIENTSKIAEETSRNYGSDKVKIWTAIGILLFLGGAIITLSIMAIDSKIKEGINSALSAYEVKVIQ